MLGTQALCTFLLDGTQSVSFPPGDDILAQLAVTHLTLYKHWVELIKVWRKDETLLDVYNLGEAKPATFKI